MFSSLVLNNLQIFKLFFLCWKDDESCFPVWIQWRWREQPVTVYSNCLSWLFRRIGQHRGEWWQVRCSSLQRTTNIPCVCSQGNILHVGRERENGSQAFQHNSSSPHRDPCSWEHRLPLLTQLGQMFLVKGQWSLQVAKYYLSQLTWQSQGGFVGFSAEFCYWEWGIYLSSDWKFCSAWSLLQWFALHLHNKFCKLN